MVADFEDVVACCLLLFVQLDVTNGLTRKTAKGKAQPDGTMFTMLLSAKALQLKLWSQDFSHKTIQQVASRNLGLSASQANFVKVEITSDKTEYKKAFLIAHRELN